ncbi:MAG: NADH:flavin oxidoreductase [Promethearchaeota archaeon Loki_b31]|nr:MAG: NADH:flavin oxidoreductase [Candidatus Lokiarchaeota archaeon Loki_b31]
MKFFKLFEPLKISNITLSNRIVMPAMHLGLANDGFITKKLTNFYVERAKGGAGLLVVGGCYVDIYAKGLPSMIAVDDDKYLPKLTEFTKTVHDARENVKICCQLYHGGAYAFPQIIGRQPIAPSAVYSKFSKTTPKEMTLEDIKREQQAFIDATIRAKKAGFDAVEICANAGYLMDQFISPKTNKRNDQYGGSLENRLRFPIETIKLMRSSVPDFVIGYRISGDDFVPGSNTYKEKAIIAEELGKYLDYFNVTGGWHETKTPQLTMDVPEGCYTYLAENIKKHVSIPIFSSNRINTPELAEQVLMAGKADAICIGRGLIADPYLPMKASKGELRDIMNCIGCNQGCFDNVFRMMPVTCLRNARAGNEARTELKPLKEKKKVMVIGSGPGGLEAARVAAIRGHEVHIFEKEDKIGGLLNIIWVPPGRNEFKRMIENYTYWIQKHGIRMHLQQEVSIEKVKEFNPDVVFIATGSKPTRPPIKGIERKNVYWANDVFSGDAPVGKNNVIIGGGATGIELAIFLTKYGALSREAFDFLTFYKALETEIALEMLHEGRNQVTVLEMLPKLGSALGKTTKWVLLDKCDALGVKLITSVNIQEIGDDYVNYLDAADKEQVINNVDYIYYATGVEPNDSLSKEIKLLNIKVEKIGDVRKPQTVMEAVARGYKIGNVI